MVYNSAAKEEGGGRGRINAGPLSSAVTITEWARRNKGRCDMDSGGMEGAKKPGTAMTKG